MTTAAEVERRASAPLWRRLVRLVAVPVVGH
jgi:hypothetical protein